jgi:phage shock protein C
MYCTRCGVELAPEACFCSGCGRQTAQKATEGAVPHYPRLSRPVYDKKIAGVCAGFARYLGVDVTLVRIVWLVLIFWPLPVGLIAYVVAWIVMPRDPLALPEAKPETAPSGPHPANGTA